RPPGARLPRGQPHRLPLGRGPRPRRALPARDQHPARDDADLARSRAGGLPRPLLRGAGALDGGGRLVLPVKAPPRPPARRDPAPSRLRYKLNRLWLRPAFRRATNFGVPAAVGLLAALTLMAQYDVRGQVLALVGSAREAIIDRPQFVITEVSVPDVSRDLAEQIRVAA